MTYSTFSNRIAGEIRAELARQRMPVSDLSSGSGIALSTLSRRLTGRTDFTVSEVEAICVALDLPVVSLISRSAASDAA